MTAEQNNRLEYVAGANEIYIRKRLKGTKIPLYMQDGIINYFCYQIPPGHFLQSIIKNDLYGAIMHADQTNSKLIGEYVHFFYNSVPAAAWGSEEKYNKWLKFLKDD